jgi:hypothetical protein
VRCSSLSFFWGGVLLFIPPFCALVTSYRGFGNVIVQITFVVVHTAILEITSELEKELKVHVPFKEKKRVDDCECSVYTFVPEQFKIDLKFASPCIIIQLK